MEIGCDGYSKETLELYNLDDDDRELDDQAGQHGELLAKLVKQFALWNRGVKEARGLITPRAESVREPEGASDDL